MLRHLVSVAALCLLLAPPLRAQVTSEEKKALSDTLFLNNLTLRDLDFRRRSAGDQRGLPFIRDCIDHPLAGADKLLDLHQRAARSTPSELLRVARVEVLSDPLEPREPITGLPEGRVPKEVPPEIAAVVASYARAVAQANEYVRRAVSTLSPAEKRLLIDSLPTLAAGSKEVRFGFQKGPAAAEEKVLPLLGKVNLALIQRVAEVLSGQIERELPALKAFATQTGWSGRCNFTWGQLNVVVSGVGNDVHDEKTAQLIIDLGGQNRYTWRAGAGVLGAAVLVDCGGDNVYAQKELGAGTGLLGVGLAYQLGGTCLFSGGNLCFGAGIAGVGMLYKEGGSDSYTANSLSQGFGAFGIGLLIDTGGNDTYKSLSLAQGAAKSHAVGWLADQQGNDMYSLSGIGGRACGQGFSEGSETLAGGVGLLTDAAGNDSYVGASFCQGASETLAVGSIFDGGGNDYYMADARAQASGTHEAAAFLFDIAGNDSYVVNSGFGHAFAEDHAVAMLIDRSGDDLYTGTSSKPGSGTGNGLGLFLDVSGQDRYMGPPGTGDESKAGGSLGLFVDMDGNDRYAEGMADDAAVVRTGEGVAYAIKPRQRHAVAGVSVHRPPALGSKSPVSDAEMEKLYKAATASSASESAADELIAIGRPAFQWLLDRSLTLASTSGEELIGRMAVLLDAPAREQLALKLIDKNPSVVGHALQACIDGQVKEASPLLGGLMRQPRFAHKAATLAGLLSSRDSVPDLMSLCAQPDQLAAAAAANALVTIADPQTLSTGEALLSSHELPVRSAAIQLVGELPGGVEVGQRLAASLDEAVSRTGIQILARAGTPEALEAIGAALSNVKSGVRIQALLGLAGRVPAKFAAKVEDLKNDPSPLVKAIARGMDLSKVVPSK
jgi:HEAT repeat protein